MLTKIDAVADAFATRVDDIAAKHRMMCMQLHAAQARLRLLEQEKIAKAQELATANDKAGFLKGQLASLNENFVRLKTAATSEASSVISLRHDEPILLDACRRALHAAQQDESQWKAASERIVRLGQTWAAIGDSTFLRPLFEELNTSRQLLDASTAEERRLAAQLAEMDDSLAAAQQSDRVPEVAPSLYSGESAVRRLEEELATERRRFEDEEAIMARNVDSLRAEITELHTKANSLSEWVAETRAAHASAVAAAGMADQTARLGLCPTCAASRPQ